MNIGSVQMHYVASIESIHLVQEFFSDDDIARKGRQDVEGHLEAVELRELDGGDVDLSYSLDFGSSASIALVRVVCLVSILNPLLLATLQRH
jgi:hypothetical protein